MLAVAALPACSPSGQSPDTTPPSAAASKLQVNPGDLHLLRRISFGATVQELDQVRKIGQAAYIEQQFQLSDSQVELQAIALYPTITYTSKAAYLSTLSGFIPELPRQNLQLAMIYRAAFSKAQLHEVMTEFWNDHFNTDLNKNPITDKIPFDRDVIRANALGNFKTLMKATLRTPEMLFYLDNCDNAVGDINENYARELLELHTMGVAGGYTEADMKALSHILSGLGFVGLDQGLNTPLSYGTVYFDASKHDTSQKVFLDTVFPEGGGEEEIDRALNLILDHPGTAGFIARKLCARFISDNPPSSIVDRVAATFTSSGGDIKAMLRLLLSSSEFAASAGQRIKRPVTAFISAVRALGMNAFDGIINGGVFNADGILFQGLVAAGQEPFCWTPPNGYPDTVAYWDSTNALLYHQRFAAALLDVAAFGRILTNPLSVLSNGGNVSGNPVSYDGLPGSLTARQLVDNVVTNLLFSDLPGAAYQSLLSYASDGGSADAPVNANFVQAKTKGVVYAVLTSPWFLAR